MLFPLRVNNIACHVAEHLINHLLDKLICVIILFMSHYSVKVYFIFVIRAFHQFMENGQETVDS